MVLAFLAIMCLNPSALYLVWVTCGGTLQKGVQKCPQKGSFLGPLDFRSTIYNSTPSGDSMLLLEFAHVHIACEHVIAGMLACAHITCMDPCF